MAIPMAVRRVVVLATTLCGLFAASACTEDQSVVRLKVEVKTNQGDPVSGAVVTMDGKALGQTDNAGAWQAEISLPVQSRKRLEVKKDSDIYYFAPFFESFVVGETTPQAVNIQATLYFVPKPTADTAAVAPTVTPPAPAPAVEPVPAETQTAATEVPAETPGQIEEEDLVTPPLPQTLSPTLADKDPLEAIGEPEPEVELDAVDAEDTVAAVQAALTPVDIAGPAGSVYPKVARAIRGAKVFTVHVYAGEDPVPEAQVFLGEEAEGDLKLACTTNARGRCVIRFADVPELSVTIMATKKGYKTQSVKTPIADRSKLKINLERGQTIDIYAITKAYNYTVGLKDVEVFINGKTVGLTDRFGRYSHVRAGKADDLITVSLKPKAHLPESFETDFVAADSLTLVKYFSPVDPPPVRMTIMSVQPAGQVEKGAESAFDGSVDRMLAGAARSHLFSSAAFREYPLALYNRAAKKAGRPLGELVRRGWQDTDLKATVDALLMPTLITSGKPVLELSVVDSMGRVLAAAKEDLDSASDRASIDRAVSLIAKKIARAFPFEGAVLTKEADKAFVNIGYGSGRGIKAGDVLEVYGMQAGKFGRSQTHSKIATLTVREVFDNTSKCAVTKLLPRASIERGDLVVLRARKAPDGAGAQVRVVGNAKGGTQDPVTQANVYFNDFWLGATDESGRLYVDVSGSGTLKVLKHGFQTYAQPVTIGDQTKLAINLRRETAFLRIDSKPTGAPVKIEGKLIGRTPISAPIAVPAGFVKLEIAAPSGFKNYETVLELDQGTLDLSGVNAVALERDYRLVAHNLVKSGKITEAVAKYDEIPKEHSDYLLGRHEVGEIYLTMLDQPAQAAAAFAAVTAEPSVKEFQDKRFIGSHVDEGVALFMTAEKLAASDPESAKAHYQKSIEVFENVLPQLRFVPSEQYAQAVHNVDFHRALARHKLWLYSQDPRILADTVRSWRSYLDGSARTVPIEGASKVYVENARVYFKQAMGSLSTARPTVNQ